MREIVTTACEVLGAASVSVGAGWIYRPAGLIVAGVCMMVFGVRAA